MNIAAISDTHGIIKKDKIPEIQGSDILLIAGDTCDLYVQRNIEKSREWYKKFFIPWTQSLDVNHIVMIGGNHDFFLEEEADSFREMIDGTNITYLENEYLDIDGVTIYGTPLCHKFFNWAFMPSDEEQEKVFKETMDDRKIDILLSHDAPYGCSDICFESTYDNQSHIGNHVLRRMILDKKPAWNIHGHLHSANHKEEILDNTKVYNVSLINENYALAYKPLIFQI